MAICQNCGKRLPPDSDGEYCSKDCSIFGKRRKNGFCKKCMEETTDESAGRIYTLNGIGTTLRSASSELDDYDECPNCGSIVLLKWFSFVKPIFPIDRYRYLPLSRWKGITDRSKEFIARRIKLNPLRKLEILVAMKESNEISEEEFKAEKNKILTGN